MNHLQESGEQPVESPPRRGEAHQRRERTQEQAARGHAVKIGMHLFSQGLNRTETANLLDLSPRTFQQWRHDFAMPPQAPCPLGRPVLRSDRDQRNEVIHLIDEVGPAIGVPALREAFPHLLRAELDDLLKRYRRVWRKRNQEPIRVLHWRLAGRVWAIDFTGPGLLIEGGCSYLLAVRDLASGQQLLWQPCVEATAAVAVEVVTSLFMAHGAPLVLKSDNGSTFTAEVFQKLAEEFTVELLFSPPGFPRYNGAIEAGIGSLKTRTQASAARHGHPGLWTWDDIEAARLEANATARSPANGAATPEQVWQERPPLTSEERNHFRTEVNRQRQAVDVQGGPLANPQTDLSERARDRQAIRRALEGRGYLSYTRRQIPLPIRKKKSAIIP